MTTIRVETRLPFNYLLRTLHQLSQAELTQLVDYASAFRSDGEPKANDFQAQLEEMANDPNIQRELALIESDFSTSSTNCHMLSQKVGHARRVKWAADTPS